MWRATGKRSAGKASAAPEAESAETTITSTGAVPEFLNFRDLSSAHSSLLPGKVFRAACPVNASHNDVAYISNTLGVGSVIDLRAAEEVLEFGQAPVLQGANVLSYKRQGGWFAPPALVVSEERMSGEAQGHDAFTVHLISVLDRFRFVRTLLPRIQLGKIANIVAKQFYDTQRSQDLIIQEINRGGLEGLYEITLLASTVEFGQAMKVVLASLRAGDPIMFYCKAGKDRTGLLAMLILDVCRVPEDAILEDYHISDQYGTVALGDLVDKREVQSLDRALFARAPKEAMLHARLVIKDRFGSVRAYLEHCGFSHSEQLQMRSLLTQQ